MTTTTWETTLDEQPLDLRVSHDTTNRELVVWVDGFPTRRERVPEVVWPQHRVQVPINGHQAEIVLTPSQHGWRYEACIDGTPIRHDSPDANVWHEQHGQDWWPARLEFDGARYYELFPAWPRACALACTLGALLGGVAAWRGWTDRALTQPVQALLLLALTSTFTGIAWWWTDRRRMRELMGHAELKPGVVVGVFPTRIAVPVDLAYSPEYTAPAVVVVEQPLERVRVVRVGDRVPMVLSYDHSQDGRLWHGLTLVAAECACSDLRAVAHAAATLPEEAWEQAQTWNEAAGGPTVPGRWHIPSPPTGARQPASDRS